MGKKKDITSKAKSLEVEVNLFDPPPSTPKAPHAERAFLVSLQWRPPGDTMVQMRKRYPLLDIDAELAKCLEWHHRTDTRRVKWDKTFWDWLARAEKSRLGIAIVTHRDRASGFSGRNRPPAEPFYNPGSEFGEEL
jgi:hypothetical protein